MAKSSQQSAILSVKKRIVPVSKITPYARVLLYGLNASQKTRTAATGPKHLIIDVNEEGSLSVKNYEGVDVFPAKTWSDVVHAYWFLRNGEHDYESYSIDTITNMQTVCMTRVLKEAEDRDPMKDPKSPQWKDYGKVNTLMKEYLLYFRNLPMHCVFIAQEKAKDDDEGDTKHFPDLSPGCRGTALACVNFIGHMRVKEVKVTNRKTKEKTVRWKPIMLIGPDETYITKDRSNTLGRYVVEPRMSQIIEAAKYVKETE